MHLQVRINVLNVSVNIFLIFLHTLNYQSIIFLEVFTILNIFYKNICVSDLPVEKTREKRATFLMVYATRRGS